MAEGEIHWAEITLGRQLGEGGFGIVYQAKRGGHDDVAVKKIKSPSPSWDACMNSRELRAFKTVGKHPNIVLLHELVLSRPTLTGSSWKSPV